MSRWLMGLVSLLFTLTVSATTLTVYEQPDEKAKVTFSVDSGEALIPIIQKGQWLKVANPKDGNVGWIKTATISDDKTPKVYRMIEYRHAAKLKPEEVDKLIAQMQQRQELFDRQMQVMMQSMFNSMRAMHVFDPFWDHPMVPVIVVPEQALKIDRQEAKSTEAKVEKSSMLAKIKEKLSSDKSKS